MSAVLRRGAVENVVLAVVAAVLVAWAVVDAAVHAWGGVPLAVRLVVAVAATLPLAGLRRAPELATGVVVTAVAGLAVGWPVDDAPPALDIAFLVASFGLAAFANRRRPALWAALGAVVVASTLRDPGQRAVSDVVWLSGTWALCLAVGLLVSEREASERAHRAAAADTREAAPELVASALARERARIARDLHDVVTSSVTVMVRHARTGRAAAAAGDPAAAAELTEIERTGQAALAELRRMLEVMRGPVDRPTDPQPGLDAVPQLVARSLSGRPARARLEGDLDRVPPGVGVAAYRIVEDALADVRRRAPTARVEVVVGAGPHELTVEVRDDGPTTPRGRPDPGRRVGLYGGRLEAGPGATGWRVRAVLPY